MESPMLEDVKKIVKTINYWFLLKLYLLL
jgi:hypothetical protein